MKCAPSLQLLIDHLTAFALLDYYSDFIRRPSILASAVSLILKLTRPRVVLNRTSQALLNLADSFILV